MTRQEFFLLVNKYLAYFINLCLILGISALVAGFLYTMYQFIIS